MSALHLNAESFDALIGSGKLTLVDFWATWCGPCKMLAPTIEELAAQYEGKVAVAKVDVDENQDLALRFGVMSIPTVILFQDGQEVSRQVGLLPKETYCELLDSRLG